jgi:hypothetical protein
LDSSSQDRKDLVAGSFERSGPRKGGQYLPWRPQKERFCCMELFIVSFCRNRNCLNVCFRLYICSPASLFVAEDTRRISRFTQESSISKHRRVATRKDYSSIYFPFVWAQNKPYCLHVKFIDLYQISRETLAQRIKQYICRGCLMLLLVFCVAYSSTLKLAAASELRGCKSQKTVTDH